jgi:hypothetical protein
MATMAEAWQRKISGSRRGEDEGEGEVSLGWVTFPHSPRRARYKLRYCSLVPIRLHGSLVPIRLHHLSHLSWSDVGVRKPNTRNDRL